MDARNLRAELARNDIDRRKVAEALGIKQPTLSGRLYGKTDFKVEELIIIRDTFLPTYSLDYLAGAIPNQRRK